jgi:hypothetical protein
MKFNKRQIVTLATGALATLAIIVTLINPNAQPQADKLNQLSQKVEQLGTQLDEGPATQGKPRPSVVGGCWEVPPEDDNGPPYRCDAWTYGEFVVKLGQPDSDGEIRTLVAKDKAGKVIQVGQIPKNLTYIKGISEFDNTPYNDSPSILGAEGNSSFRIELYLSETPRNIFDYRLPVMIKYIEFSGTE